MSRIDELIAKHCPNGVEHLPFTAVGKFSRGGGPQKKDFQDSGVGCIHYGQIYTHYGTAANIANKFVSEDVASKSRQAQPGDVIIAVTGENDDDLARGVAWLGSQPVAVSNHTLIFSSDLDPRYVSYFLRSSSFDKEKRRHIMGTKVRSISAGAFEKILIPVPPLEVQRGIVEVLDTFSKLEAELEARKQQYEHYRTELLSDSHGGDIQPLGEIFEMRAGTHVRAAEIADTRSETHPYPCFGGNGVRGFVAGFNYNEDVAFIGRQGALCGNVHRSEGRIYATEHAVVVTPKMPVDMSWAFHKLTEMDLNQYKTKSAQPGLAVGRIKELIIPLPPLDEQRRIVAILDKFDALVNDLSVGLPAELAARRQQYEYYRDKLLTFKELEVAA